MNAEKPAPKMRSSIACARCRRSKVKCINNGVNTPCRACEATGRECTYPPPATPGSRSVAGPSANVGGGSVGWNGEKRPRPKRPAHSSGSQAHLIPKDGSARPLSEALDPNVLTPAVWSQTYDLLTLHYPHLPILHRPTFLRPLTEAGAATSTPPPNSTSSASPPTPSPFLLLAILTLVGRFSPALIAHHNTTPINTSEYYANALRSRFLSDDDDGGILVPSLPKIQSLIMLGVHELGQSNGERAWIWLGIAVRMCQLLDLPNDVGDKSPIEVESERRTWWAVVLLDRMLSTSTVKGRAFAFGWERIRGVPLPCSERAWLFGDRVRVSSLMEPITIAGVEKSAEVSNGDVPGLPDETGADESVHSRLIRLVDIWGRVCQFLCGNSETFNHQTLMAELDRWRNDLPRSLSYTPQNLQAHISAHTSSAYALLHIMYYLCILLLHRESLPVAPSETNTCFSAARKITEIAREMHTWLSLPLTPVVCFAIYCTAWVGIYGLHYPHVRGAPEDAMGAGDALFLLSMIDGWKPKWRTAEGWLKALAAEHAFLGFRRGRSGLVEVGRKRRWSGEDEEMDVDEEDSDEMRNFDRTIREIMQVPSKRQAKKPRSNIASSVGGDSDTEMQAENKEQPLQQQQEEQADRWVAVNTGGIQGLIAAAAEAKVEEKAEKATPEPPKEPVTPTAPAAPASSADSTEPHDRERFLFEGWGKRGIARIDLVGFAEGKKWQEWGEGDDNWFASGIELMSLVD